MTSVVWSPQTRRHDPQAEIWVGVRTPGTEVADRVDRILAALRSEGHDIREAKSYDDQPILAVHDAALVHHLRTVAEEWRAAGFEDEIGQDRVVPYVFPTPGMLDGLPPHAPTAVHARAGWFCYDTMTLVGPGTWEASKAAVDCALTAVDLVAARESAAAYALCRPPGHHVTRSAYGGSCYLNNAAIAASALGARGFERVAVVDVDAHHGNGTEAIFYDRGDVFYGSLHVDPGAGWFPHVVGYADERGIGEGTGTTLNVPLPPGTGDRAWLEALDAIIDAIRGFRAAALVISLGVDAAADDPESPLQVTGEGYRGAGERLADLGLPTVAVQEGGYHLATLGGLVAGFLHGFG